MKPESWTPRVGIRNRIREITVGRSGETWDGAERFDCSTAVTPCVCGSHNVVQLYTGPRCRKCGRSRPPQTERTE